MANNPTACRFLAHPLMHANMICTERGLAKSTGERGNEDKAGRAGASYHGGQENGPEKQPLPVTSLLPNIFKL